ncbi:hypothetical protein OG21DRAFT_1487750 [Imleria badia]|nr:hypothetical protein OG21DRAFT_1487750 [Imleria badia]
MPRLVLGFSAFVLAFRASVLLLYLFYSIYNVYDQFGSFEVGLTCSYDLAGPHGHVDAFRVWLESSSSTRWVDIVGMPSVRVCLATRSTRYAVPSTMHPTVSSAVVIAFTVVTALYASRPPLLAAPRPSACMSSLSSSSSIGMNSRDFLRVTEELRLLREEPDVVTVDV